MIHAWDSLAVRIESEDWVEQLALTLLLPFRGPIRLHALGLCLACSGRPPTLVLCSGRSSLCERRHERILRRPATPFDRTLESFNRQVEFVALCDE